MSRIPQLSQDASPADYEAWIRSMHEKDLLFHFEDDPRDIIELTEYTRLFTDDEATQVAEYVNILFHKLGDPFILAVKLTSGQT
jgi:hypothetical protein